MLTYTTLFVVCVILALVVRFLYKAISESSGSVSTSKEGIALSASPTGGQKDKAARNAVTGTASRSGQTSQVTTQNRAKKPPAEQLDWGWQGSGVQVREPQHATSVGTSSHCSLYEASSAEPKDNPKQHVGWPYREEKLASGVRTYTVTRKVAKKTPKAVTKTPRFNTKTPKLNAIVKPWGW